MRKAKIEIGGSKLASSSIFLYRLLPRRWQNTGNGAVTREMAINGESCGQSRDQCRVQRVIVAAETWA